METLTFQSKLFLSLEALLLYVFYKTKDAKAYVFLTQNLSWPIKVTLPCWHFGIHKWI